MSQTVLNFAIENAFQVLAAQSMELFDAWYERLHDVQMIGDIEHTTEIESEWTESNCELMLQGVMPAAWLSVLSNTHWPTLYCTFGRIMSKQVILSMLSQGNTGDELLSILDVIVADIEEEGINSCAEVFAVN